MFKHRLKELKGFYSFRGVALTLRGPQKYVSTKRLLFATKSSCWNSFALRCATSRGVKQEPFFTGVGPFFLSFHCQLSPQQFSALLGGMRKKWQAALPLFSIFLPGLGSRCFLNNKVFGWFSGNICIYLSIYIDYDDYYHIFLNKRSFNFSVLQKHPPTWITSLETSKAEYNKSSYSSNKKDVFVIAAIFNIFNLMTGATILDSGIGYTS